MYFITLGFMLNFSSRLHARLSDLILDILLVSHPTFVIYDDHAIGVPTHEHMSMHLLVSFKTQAPSSFSFELCSLELGWETTFPTGTHHVMSMGM